MPGRPLVACDSPELSTELAGLAHELAIDLEILVAERPLSARPDAQMYFVAETPSEEELLERAGRAPAPVLVTLSGELRSERLSLQLGLIACPDPSAGLAALLFVREGVIAPSSLSLRALSPLARKRLGLAGGRGSARLEPADGGKIALARGEGEPVILGRIPDVASALRALSSRRARPPAPMPEVEGADRRVVHDVILGPPRALSDPASKSVLYAYGLPLPLEELCSSPSRAAAEAARIGFPVRLALASPDLRPSEHADLHVDGVDSASRVRELYRQMMTLASSRREGARLLGVTVSASTTAKAILSVRLERMDDERVVVDFGFADPHGAASNDAGLVVLPTDPEGLEHAIASLRGHALLFGETPGEKRHFIGSFAELVFRIAALARDFPAEIVEIELPRLAVLPGGDLEIREAKIEVGDAFSRQLEARR